MGDRVCMAKVKGRESRGGAEGGGQAAAAGGGEHRGRRFYVCFVDATSSIH